VDGDLVDAELIGPEFCFGLESVTAAKGYDAGAVGEQSEGEGAAEEAGGAGEDGGLAFEGEEGGEFEVCGGDGNRIS
jgi:hypothetical protein